MFIKKSEWEAINKRLEAVERELEIKTYEEPEKPFFSILGRWEYSDFVSHVAQEEVTLADKVAVLEEKLGGKVKRSTSKTEFVPNKQPKKTKKKL